MRRQPYSYTLDPDVIKELRVYAALHDTKQNIVIEKALKEYFKKEKENK